MTKLTLNLENCTKEEKQKTTDIVLCYAKSQIDRNINCITAEIEDEKVSSNIEEIYKAIRNRNLENSKAINSLKKEEDELFNSLNNLNKSLEKKNNNESINKESQRKSFISPFDDDDDLMNMEF